MTNPLIEQHIENVVHDAIGDTAMNVVKRVSALAAKQGGQTSIENYQLLGKRALIAIGVAIVAVQVVTSVAGLKISRKMEEKRIEETVRRVLAEEREREQAANSTSAS